MLDKGCKEFPEIKAIADDKARKAACQSIRRRRLRGSRRERQSDRPKLEADTHALGVFGYSYLEQNGDKIQASVMDGVEATVDNITSGKYEVSRLLYFYVKNQHLDLVPGIKEYVAEFMSDRAGGEDGYLADKGMIPLPADKFKAAQQSAMSLQPMIKPLTTLGWSALQRPASSPRKPVAGPAGSNTAGYISDLIRLFSSHITVTKLQYFLAVDVEERAERL